MNALFFACRWWPDLIGPNREPGGNPGLPRSGKQERTPIKALVLSGTGKPGLVEIRRKSRESLQVRRPASGHAIRACNCANLRGEVGNGRQFFSCLIISPFLSI